MEIVNNPVIITTISEGEVLAPVLMLLSALCLNHGEKHMPIKTAVTLAVIKPIKNFAIDPRTIKNFVITLVRLSINKISLRILSYHDNLFLLNINLLTYPFIIEWVVFLLTWNNFCKKNHKLV